MVVEEPLDRIVRLYGSHSSISTHLCMNWPSLANFGRGAAVLGVALGVGVEVVVVVGSSVSGVVVVVVVVVAVVVVGGLVVGGLVVGCLVVGCLRGRVVVLGRGVVRRG